MAFIHGNVYGSNSSFNPLFRFLDEFDRHCNDGTATKGNTRRNGNGITNWQPKFDVIEAEHMYELHGDIPGVKKEDVHIEFTEPQTIVIRGKIERSYSTGNPSAGQIEAGATGAITQGEEHKKMQATVEDENSGSSGTVVKKSDGKAQNSKYWLTERSVGEFSRSFSFPTNVDQDGVRAAMDNGVLTVSVPKAKKSEGKRIAIK